MKAKIGDKVMMSDDWMKSTQAGPVFGMAQGTILDVKPLGRNQYCKVQWVTGEWAGDIKGVLSSNLQKHP